MINPALWSHGFPHGAGRLLVVMRAPRICPVCHWATMLWISHPEHERRVDCCLGCASAAPSSGRPDNTNHQEKR